jgi:hypothetical protein
MAFRTASANLGGTATWILTKSEDFNIAEYLKEASPAAAR